jgi:two-component sensor histidine kinase
LAWRVDDGVRFWFGWRERGGPIVRSPRQRGFGSRLLDPAVSYELQGQASIELAPEGVRYEITAPLRELVERT